MPIDRRALLGSIAPLLAAATPVRAAPGPQPNADVVVVITDDMRDGDWVALPQTAALVAAEGTFFPNFFTNTPTCSPSRATALTGMHAHTHGVAESEGGFTHFRRRGLGGKTVFAALPATHRGGFFGKFLNGYDGTVYTLPGVHRWWATFDLDYTNFLVNLDGDIRQTNGYYTTEQSDRVAQFLETTTHPVLAYVATRAPHPPSVPHPQDRGAFAGAEIERTPALNEADVSDKPRFVRRARKRSMRGLDQQHRRRLETLLSVDRMLVRIHAALKARGNPFYLMICTDNGRMLGEHRLVNKGQPYDPSVRITMAAIGPGFAAGATDPRLVGMVDVAPTVAAVLGLDMPWLEGVDLRGDHDRDAILLEKPDEWTGMRTRDGLYVERRGGEREYYDRAADPHELDNLLANWGGFVPRLSPEEQAELAAQLDGLRGT